MTQFSGMWTARQQLQATGESTWPAVPGAPTIGTATIASGTSVSVGFTAPSYTGYPAGITSYTATSSPGGLTGTGASSPITVSGLTTGTAYTFTVTATNATGTGPASAASNSVTPSVNYIEDVFSTYLYAGNSSTQSIVNGIDLSTKGGMVWTKSRNAAYDNTVYDTVRGIGGTKALYTDTSDAQGAYPSFQDLTAYNTNGYSIGSPILLNETGINYVSWTFAEQTKFFDVVTWSGDSTSGRQIAHNLGSTPGMVMIKSLAVDNWCVWHRGLTAGRYIVLNSTAAQTTSGAVNRYGNGTTTVDPTSTYITVGSNGEVNQTGNNYVAYVFANDAGGFGLTGSDNVISCGSYTGTNETQNITLGYEPQFLMVKNISTNGTNWFMMDTMRGLNATNKPAYLYANAVTSEGPPSPELMGISSTGFVPVSSNAGTNASGSTYIYIAIRKGPMKVPTDATTVFQANAYTGNATANTTVAGSFGFPVDMMLLSSRSANSTAWSSYAQMVTDKLRSVAYVSATANTNAQSADWTTYQSFTVPSNVGWGLYGTDSGTGYMNNSGGTFVARGFRRAPQFFDEVIVTNGTTTYTHNLTIAPELIMVKCTSAAGANWVVYSKSLGTPASDYLSLNTTDAVLNQTSAWTPVPTSTQFSVSSGLWANGTTGVAYLFGTCPGVSKVGSYTGTGATQTIACGFTGGARFVLIKRTDSPGNWWVWNTATGMVSGTDPRVALSSTAAEVNADWVYTATGGFQIVTSEATVNQSGGSYIFLAIA